MKTHFLIALLTDFGLADPYVGIMKGIIWDIAPGVPIVDLTHHIRPQNILQGSFLLHSTYRQLPKGTIFVCVVDPGVGTHRLPVLVTVGKYAFVGPDNGLFGFLNGVPGKMVIHLQNKNYFRPIVSKTFHGRDIFAPVAAHLAAKGQAILPDLGPTLPRLREIEGQFPDVNPSVIRGKIMHIDRFGNLITNIHSSHLKNLSFDKSRMPIKVKDISLPMVATFSEAPASTPCALIGSSDHVEIFVKNGSAEATLNAKIGDSVHVLKHHH